MRTRTFTLYAGNMDAMIAAFNNDFTLLDQHPLYKLDDVQKVFDNIQRLFGAIRTLVDAVQTILDSTLFKR